ncbi:Mitochondrial import inner membrane translocase subunit TIM23 [Wickerhamomyces ciferrii]|uniref:Mitochondrial import inner membrane translocase subunit TIM23 n=1 Tax=Wickerhamomyces ciferrii (strain ATCC 14091 / BCRC 22168 / CBS 111 / JCM 3599 / NBRC 0793 / NRRL Y-1031 F-60-10) TaxID=1206466 RepID=K0KIE7_WICCF|nr:Mitochondrial import inner membrane translocase subunit TIM23 [Wickerhamomyces ciferrii]CCH41947.1 Mitochondrial import inner membrane translocase subunit TIM23 [Wickerhamomyces ciferrii]
MASWLGFGGSSKKEDTTQQTSQINNNLGFDPSSISDVSSIISTPGGLDTSRLHPLAGLEKGVEYLDLEDENLTQLEGAQGLIPSRGWTDDLCYGTGAVYLLGLGLGGSYGFFEGLRNIPANSPGRLRLNTVLNHVTKRGPFLGNTAGVLALTYNLIDSTIDGLRGKHDAINSIAAGAISGALFKSTKGLKPAGIASGLMAGAAATWCGIKALLA